MPREYRRGNRQAGHCRLVLFTVSSWLACAADAYDANHDQKLDPPTPEQVEQALEAGERFQYQLPPVPLAGPPGAIIPEEYTAQVEPYRPPARPPYPYDYYRWRWGPRVFWPCERLDPFHRYSIYLWGDRPHEPDHGRRWDPYDMWCPPAYGSGSWYPYHWGEP